MIKNMKILHFETLESTNKYLIENHNVLEDNTIVSCDFQTNGKGRELRQWDSTKHQNLLISFLIKNPKNICKFHIFSLCSAVCVMKVLEKNSIKNVSIKWPNDVYVNDKKICGVLLQGEVPKYIVIGIGVNVNQIAFEGNYSTCPTSMKLESNILYDIEIIKQELICEMLTMFNNYDQYLKSAISNNYVKNKTISINGKKFVADDICPDGKLKAYDEKGNEHYLDSGEITF